VRLLGPILCCALALASSSVRADAPEIEIARGHSRLGAQHYAAGRYREAASEFEEARKALPLPEIDYNLGRCYEALGEVDAARVAYARYLQRAAPSPDRDDVERRLRVLEVASPLVKARHEREERAAAGQRRWRALMPPAATFAAIALGSGVVSAVLYPRLLHERDLLAQPCPFDCVGSYSRAHAYQLATYATFGVAVGAAAFDVALWGVALAARRAR
jgi:tetratricopeptide (TPR) repeat protein